MSNSPDADALIAALSLVPHPEGGYYAERFRSALSVESAQHEGTRAASTAIYFLLRAGDFSALHSVLSDEVWHHYAGDPLELVLLHPDARSEQLRLGSAILEGERPQHTVRAGIFQAARPRAGGRHRFTLCGCTVAPGFEFRDFSMPGRAALLARFPEQRALIEAFTR